MKKAALAGSILCGVVGFGLVNLYMHRFEDEVTGGPPVRVLIAAANVPIGEPLTREALGVRDVPSAYVDERHVLERDIDRVTGIRTSIGLRAGEWLLWSDLATSTAERRSLSGMIRPGMRAVALRADVTSAFGGLLRPGDRVDVFLTTGVGDAEQTTRPLLQNVLVLAVGSETGPQDLDRVEAGEAPRADRAGGIRPRVTEVTLGVAVEQTALLTHATSAGRISLALRNPDDLAVAEGLAEVVTAPSEEREETSRLPSRAPSTSIDLAALSRELSAGALPVRLSGERRAAY